MDPGRCQLLQQRWQEVVQTQADQPAVHVLATSRILTFAQMARAVDSLPPAGPVVTATGKGLSFLKAVLHAWRDDAVLVPLESSAGAFRPAGFMPEPVCHVKSTSGSTGCPRQVWFTADQLMADARQIISTMGLSVDSPNLGVISMSHSYGFSNLVLPLLLGGIPLVLADSPLPGTIRQALELPHSYTLPAVPAMWRAWHQAGVLRVRNRIRLGISAGASLPLDLERHIHAEAGLKIHNFYGSSECGGIAFDRSSIPRTSPDYAGSAMDGTSLSIDPRTGCLRVESPAVGLAYADGDPSLQQGVFQTTDLATVDQSGGVRLQGRAGEAIHIAGRKIPPGLVEEKLLSLPMVKHCVVFGIPSAHPDRIEELVAAVRPSAGSGDVSAETLRRASALLLGPGEHPRHWWVCDDLEPDPRGKISRHAWRQKFLDSRNLPLRKPVKSTAG